MITKNKISIMDWKIDFYNESVEKAILNMPPKIQARMLRLLELIEKHGAIKYPS
jgi:hypothetical protein